MKGERQLTLFTASVGVIDHNMFTVEAGAERAEANSLDKVVSEKEEVRR